MIVQLQHVESFHRTNPGPRVNLLEQRNLMEHNLKTSYSIEFYGYDVSLKGHLLKTSPLISSGGVFSPTFRFKPVLLLASD